MAMELGLRGALVDEMVDEIFSHLDEASRFLYSLTHKASYQSFRQRFLPLHS